MDSQPNSRPETISVAEYVQGNFVPLSHLPHGWEMHSAYPLTPAEERMMVREPAHAVPEGVAKRLDGMRVLVVPYLACADAGDFVSFVKPAGETHTAVWLEAEGQLHLVLAGRELNPHDTGFEFLASIAELLLARLSPTEIARYGQLLDEELQRAVTGEIDEDALAAKQRLLAYQMWRRRRTQFDRYCLTSLASTLAEYMHGLWHDVQIRVGPEHLPFPALRRRLELLAEMFPPNEGYQLFAPGVEERLAQRD